MKQTRHTHVSGERNRYYMIEGHLKQFCGLVIEKDGRIWNLIAQHTHLLWYCLQRWKASQVLLNNVSCLYVLLAKYHTQYVKEAGPQFQR